MIKYPNKKESFKAPKISTKNRGMGFENVINETNEYYLNNNLAVIHKKPIPIQIVKVDYPSRSAAVIKEAYYKVPSTTDYNGLYQSRYIDFEAKETNNLTSFPLQNIHPHQIKHLEEIDKQGGIAFILVYFKKLDQVYYLSISKLLGFVDRSQTGRKSIALDEFKQFGHYIKEGFNPRIDYLKIVDKYIKGSK
ncbi:Holliday junction resolvase RecU [Candidatus Izimaplasma sp. ZiA1]|uniref:Holliday junction resolvase RecU n=1 Tax=Candidatus Izimoplasma sp. ZiA1 TaxID=2024899 RepID=UPI001F0A32E4